MRRRVMVTGMGALSSAGKTLEEHQANFVAGKPCLFEIGDPRLSHLRARYAGLMKDWPGEPDRGDPETAGMDRHVAMALAAARDALTSARVDPRSLGSRLGLVFATCSGPMLLIERHYERIVKGDPRISREELFAKKYSSGALSLARALGISGFATTVVTACTAGTAAIALAGDLIRCGMLDVVLAGGSDAFSTSTLAGFDGLKATSGGRCAPFSKPFGLNLGEAAVFLCLEALDTAERRGARLRAELEGAGLSNDAFHCSSPEPTGRGLSLAMRRAVQDSGADVEHISYINAHGTGTEANDKAETRAIRRVFGPAADRVPVSSTKSMVGHCLGAAGAIEIVASILCAEAGVLPPTAGFAGAREGCDLDYVPDAGRAWTSPRRRFLSSNLAFGGHNACLVLNVDPGEGMCAASASGPGETPICITAAGLVSAFGLGADPLLMGIESASPASREIRLRHGPVLRAATVEPALLEKFDRRLDLRHMDKSSRLATVACRLALRAADYPESPPALNGLGFYLHLATGPSWAEEEFLTSYLAHDRQVNQVGAFPYIVPSSVAGNVCRALRLTGHNVTLSGGPGAGLRGLVPAAAAIRAGHTQALLTGAVDELSDRILTDLLEAGEIPREPTAPGEGGAMLLLETEAHARAREAALLGTLCGLSCGGSVREAVDAAMQSGKVAPEEIGRVVVQGAAAGAEISRDALLGPGARTVSVASLTGEMEAAQGLIDLAVALLQPSTHPAEPTGVLAVTGSKSCGGAVALIIRRTG